MIRKYKSWRGLALATLIALIIMYALIILLINGYVTTRDSLPFVIIILIAMVVSIAYTNFMTLQLRFRFKEFYVRKLLGASDKQIMLQLLLESVVLAVFLVVSGMVLAELVSPFGGWFIAGIHYDASITFLGQILMVAILVLPIVLLTAVLPIRSFLIDINTNLAKGSRERN